MNEFESTDADIITAKRATYSSDMTTFLKIEPNDKVIDHIKYDSVEDLFEFMNGCNYIFGSVTAKTKKLLESFPYDEEYKLIEDYSSIMKLLRMGYNIHFFNRIVVKYRLGGISYAQNISKLYLKESNKLFINEILPYSKYKIKAIKNYIAWRRNIAKSK